MIRDPEAFLNPEGRSDPRGDGIFPGLTGLAVWGGSSLIERTLLKGIHKKKDFLNLAAEFKTSKEMRFFRRGKPTTHYYSFELEPRKPLTPRELYFRQGYFKFAGTSEETFQLARKEGVEKNKLAKRFRAAAKSSPGLAAYKKTAKGMRDYNAFAKSTSKFFKGIASATAISFAFSLGEKLFTPSVNKLAADKDAAVFYDESIMDSGAAYTQRQRAIMAIMDNNIAINNVIGNEASHFHR